MTMRTLPVLALVAMLSACGGGGGNGADPVADETTTAAPGDGGSPSTTDAVTEATAELLGEGTTFVTGGGGAGELTGSVDGRECVLADALFGSCRASTGAGGAFLVTAESTVENPTEWNVVVRCGLDPALPAASAQGTFQPSTTDLGLAPYGQVIGVMLRAEANEAALVYQPEGSECPVVWSLGEIDKDNLFTGGTDALNGSEAPIAFTDASGKRVCASADGSGGIAVGGCP